MPKRVVWDRGLFLTAIILPVAGLVMVGSASNYVAMNTMESPSALFWKQALFPVAGLVALVCTLSFSYRRLNHRAVVLSLLLTCLALLIAVFAAPSVNGAHRWIPIGPFNLQPSELTKLAIVIFLAYILSRKEERVNDLWAVPLPSFVVIGLFALLVVVEPDLGSAVMMVIVAGVMMFVAGLSWRAITAVSLVGAIGFVASVIAEPFRIERIKAFLNPSADTLGASFQLNQSLIAVGSGGWTGAGLGQGHQKAFYLPAAHTDFIYSVIGEELGLLGCAALLAAFLLIFWRGMRAATRAPDRFGFYLALGLTNLIVLQALINMGVCLGLLPTKGLPLPLISYGGSSLIATMAALGLLLNVSRHSN